MGNFLLILYFFINNFQIKIRSSDEIINLFLFGIQFYIWTLFLFYHHSKKYYNITINKIYKLVSK